MTTRTPKIIIPRKERCICGGRVLNHHYFCDDCWGARAQLKYRKPGRELIYDEVEGKWKVKPREKHEENRVDH